MYRLVIFLAIVAVAHGIVGGEVTEIGKHNYQVSIEFWITYLCGGVLVKPNTVITAANCIRSLRDYLYIRAGSNTILEGGRDWLVSEVYLHPRYSTYSANDYNIAVLITDSSFSLNPHIGVIELAPKGLSVSQGTLATVTGWGGRNKNEHNYKYLQYMQVPFVPWNLCKQYAKYTLTERMSCWGYLDEQIDVCNSDQGGPLVIRDAGGKPILAAVVSSAVDCGEGWPMGFPRAYTDITNNEIYDFVLGLL